MKYAIIQTGANQTRVEEGQIITVELLPNEAGATVEYETLLLADDSGVTIGTPIVADIKVTATVLDHFKGEKIRVFKYKPKIRYRRTIGHRQQYTRLRIESIGAPSAKPSPRKRKAAAAAEPTEE